MKPYTYLLTTIVTILKCNKDGLPVKEEFYGLYKIVDTIKALLDAKFINKSAGTFSYQCERINYYYLSNTIGLRTLFQFF